MEKRKPLLIINHGSKADYVVLIFVAIVCGIFLFNLIGEKASTFSSHTSSGSQNYKKYVPIKSWNTVIDEGFQLNIGETWYQEMPSGDKLRYSLSSSGGVDLLMVNNLNEMIKLQAGSQYSYYPSCSAEKVTRITKECSSTSPAVLAISNGGILPRTVDIKVEVYK